MKTVTPLIPRRQGKPQPVTQSSSEVDDKVVTPPKRVEDDSAAKNVPQRRVEADSSVDEPIPLAKNVVFEMGEPDNPLIVSIHITFHCNV